MKAKPQTYKITPDLHRSPLTSILNLRHELCPMAELIEWFKFDKEFNKFFPSITGCPVVATRFIVGLFYLKHAFKLSNEELIARWVENPYWQYFCGEQYLQHNYPVYLSSLSKWCRHLEEAGCELLLQEMIQVGLKTETIKKQDFKEAIVDTTVQEKAVTYPTDAMLYQCGRDKLLQAVQKTQRCAQCLQR